jgi:hypothetical protein
MEQVYHIPVANINELARRLEKVNKRARKLGLPEATYTELGREKRSRGENEYGEVQVYEVVKVTVQGATPKLDGWVFVAVIQHIFENDGYINIIRRVPGQEDVALDESLRTAAPWCEHCGLSRRRNDTYVVVKDGDIKQVGSNCLGDFTGSLTPQDAARMAEYLIALDEWASGAEDSFLGSGGGAAAVPLVSFMTMTAAVIRVCGWASRGKSERGWATADLVSDQFFWRNMPQEDRLRPTISDNELAVAAIEWARGESDLPFDPSDNDYLWNLHVAVKQTFLTAREFGIAASLIPAYQRRLAESIEREKLGNSQHIGTVGKKETFEDLTVIDVRAISTCYGVSHLHSFADQNGNVLKWFAPRDQGLKPGDKVNVTGTVKTHGAYNGVNETTLNRCKVV